MAKFDIVATRSFMRGNHQVCLKLYPLSGNRGSFPTWPWKMKKNDYLDNEMTPEKRGQLRQCACFPCTQYHGFQDLLLTYHWLSWWRGWQTRSASTGTWGRCWAGRWWRKRAQNRAVQWVGSLLATRWASSLSPPLPSASCWSRLTTPSRTQQDAVSQYPLIVQCTDTRPAAIFRLYGEVSSYTQINHARRSVSQAALGLPKILHLTN